MWRDRKNEGMSAWRWLKLFVTERHRFFWLPLLAFFFFFSGLHNNSDMHEQEEEKRNPTKRRWTTGNVDRPDPTNNNNNNVLFIYSSSLLLYTFVYENRWQSFTVVIVSPRRDEMGRGRRTFGAPKLCGSVACDCCFGNFELNLTTITSQLISCPFRVFGLVFR